MSVILTTRQKNIVNPYADQTYQDRLGGQLGVDPYDYHGIRNKFVIEAIHDSYINFQNFPNIGTEMSPDVALPDGQRIITSTDARAYFSIYPQNGRLTRDSITGTQVMEPWGGDEAQRELGTLVARLRENSVIQNYTTFTTELSQASAGASQPDQDIANLMAINPTHSFPYLARLRSALGLRTRDIINPNTAPLENTLISPQVNTFVGSESNVDLYEWTKNAEPETDKEKVYFNVVDDKFYYVVRTDLTDFNSLDIAWILPELKSQGVLQKYQDIADRGIKEILKFSGRLSRGNYLALQETFGGIEAPEFQQYNLEEEDTPRFRKYNMFTSKDPRPGSRWVCAITIDQEIINSLPVTDAISYQDEALTPYQLSLVITDTEKTNVSSREPRFFENLNLAQKLVDVSDMLEEYGQTLREEGLGPILLNNIDLDIESQKIESFYDLFGSFYAYNRLSLQDDDLVQFFFDDSFRLLYICINGVAYTRATGNPNFQPEPVEGTPTVVLDAFAYLTATTFSYIYNALEISNESLLTTPQTRQPWATFLSMYTFPQPDFSPEKIDQVKRNQGTFDLSNTLSQQKNIFTKLAQYSRIPQSEANRLWNKKERYVFLSDALFASGCDTLAAQALRETLTAIAVLEGKISVRTYLRRIIQVLKREVIQDETTRRLLTAGATADPQNISREVQRLVENQIFCSLDVLGGAVGAAVLQATDSQPATNQLSRVSKDLKQPLVLEFKKLPMMNKQNRAKSAYRAVINRIITNFLKSLLAGVAKDLVKAVAGCGPAAGQSELDLLQNAFRQYDYGGVELNNLLINLDIVQIAKDVDLVNVNQEIIDDETITVKTDPSAEQLQKFIADVSKMVTPTEMTSLLGGDADDLLYRSILETVKDGSISWPIGVRHKDPGDQNVGEEFIQAIKDEFTGEDYEFIYETINPSPYDDFIFTKEKIKEFFAAIGAGLGELESEDSPSALDEFCENRDPDLTTLKLRLSEAQMIGQFDQVFSSKIARINSYCDYLRSLQSLQFQLDQLLASLPMMEWYNSILRLLARILPYLTSMLSAWWKNAFGKQPQNVSDPRYNLYSTEIGIQLFYQSYYMLHSSMVVPRLQKTSTNRFVYRVPIVNYSTDRVEIPSTAYKELGTQLILPYAHYGITDDSTSDARIGSYAASTAPQHLREKIGNSAIPARPDVALGQYEGVYSERATEYIKPYLKQIQYREPYIGFFPTVALSVRNSNDPIEPGIRIYVDSPQSSSRGFGQTNPYNNESLLASWNPQDFATEPNSPVSYGMLLNNLIEPGTQNLNTGGTALPSLSSGTGAGLQRPSSAVQQMINSFFMTSLKLVDDDNPFSIDTTDESLNVISNPSEFVETQIDRVITSDVGKRRLPRYIYGTNLEVFVANDDICVTADQKADAEAWVSVIQSRIQQFFVNTLPLARVYPCWNNTGTVNLITDYLYRKIRKELKSRNILTPLLQNFDMIEKVYADFPVENPQLVISDSKTPDENLKETIQKIFVRMLDNIARTSEYSLINRSVYDNFEVLGRDNPSYTKYLSSLFLFYQEMASQIKQGNYANLGIRDNQVTAASRLLREMRDPNTQTVTAFGEQVGSYYFPIGPLYATYLIYYDNSVKYGERYSDIYYRSQVEIAGSDDAFLGAVRGQTYSKFANKYVGFPVSVLEYNESYDITYYSTPQVEERVAYLDRLLTDPNLIETSLLERIDIEDRTRGVSQRTSEAALTVLDNGYRYMSPYDAPPEYYDAMGTVFSSAKDWLGGNNPLGNLDAWSKQPEYMPPFTEEQIEEMYEEYLVRSEQEIRTIVSQNYKPAGGEPVARLANLQSAWKASARNYFAALGSRDVGPYGNAASAQGAPNLVSVDELCTYSSTRLDSYVNGLFGERSFGDVLSETPIVKRMVYGVVLSTLGDAQEYVCLNTGPSLQSVRIEKNTLETLIKPNE